MCAAVADEMPNSDLLRSNGQAEWLRPQFLKHLGVRHRTKHFVNAACPSRNLCERRRGSARCVTPLIWHRIAHERRGDPLSSARARGSGDLARVHRKNGALDGDGLVALTNQRGERLKP
jgi:hypothetical protein